jgi:hypothetical protein
MARARRSATDRGARGLGAGGLRAMAAGLHASIPHMRPVALSLFAAAALAAGLAGCGDQGSSASTTGGRDAATTTASRPDDALVRAALVRLSDFPAGWRSRPDDPNDFRCPATAAVEAHPYAKSDRFEPPDGRGAVQHEAAVLTSERAADAALDALASPRTLGCFARQGEQSVRRQVSAGTEVGHVTAFRLTNVAAVGDRTAGARLTYPVSANGVTTTVYEDFSFSRVGRGLSLFAFVAQGTPPDATLTTDLARRGAQRLRTALTEP